MSATGIEEADCTCHCHAADYCECGAPTGELVEGCDTATMVDEGFIRDHTEWLTFRDNVFLRPGVI